MKLKLKEFFKKKEDEEQILFEEAQEDPDIRIETFEMTPDPQEKEDFWTKIKKHEHLVKNRNILAMGILCIVLFGLGAFLFFHTGSTYITADRVEKNDVSGTKYLEFGDYFLKYSSV